MADVPAEVGAGRIVGFFVSDIADGPDPGNRPDEVPLQGTITIMSTQPVVRYPGITKPRTAVAGRHVCPIIDGDIYPPGTTRDNLPPTPGVWVPATEQPHAEPNRAQYKAIVKLEGVEQQPVLPTFDVPNGDTVDLAKLVPTNPAPGVTVVVSSEDRLAAEAAAVRAEHAVVEVQASIDSSSDVVCWGDSMTASAYPAALADLSGLNVYGAGVGGERSYDIAARQGGNPILLSFDGGQIPASGPVFVTPRTSGGVETSTLMKQGNRGMNPAIVLGVQGTFSWSAASSRYVFTRSVPGTAVPAPLYPVPLIPAAREVYGNWTSIFWLGRNNLAQTDRIMEDVQSAIGALAPAKPRYLVLGVVNALNEGAGTSAHTSVLALEARQAALYGRRFVNVRRALIDYGLAVAGITPTAQDQTDIAADTVPTSLRTDNVHLNPVGSQLVARFVMERLVEFGWAEWPEGSPPVEPDWVVWASDDFSPPDGTAVGRTLNNALGGTASAVPTSPFSSYWNIAEGRLSRSSGGASGVLGIPMPQPDYGLSVRVLSVTGGSIQVIARRSAISGGTGNPLVINPDGTLNIGGTWVPGDRIGYRVLGDLVEWLKNGEIIGTAAAVNEAPGFAAFAVGASANYEVDDLIITVPA